MNIRNVLKKNIQGIVDKIINWFSEILKLERKI